MEQVLEEHENMLLQMNNVVGIFVGLKKVRGSETARKAIVVLVKKKLSRLDLPADQIVPTDIEGHETDVVESGEINIQ